MTKRYCTVPAILGFREWFECMFKPFCKAHDEAYESTYNVFKKLWADIVMVWGMLTVVFHKDFKNIILILICALGAAIILPTLGTVYWVYRRVRYGKQLN